MLRSTSDKALQNAPSQSAINQSHMHSAQVRLAPDIHCLSHVAGHCSLCGVSKTICAVPAPWRLRAAFFAYFFCCRKKVSRRRQNKDKKGGIITNTFYKQRNIIPGFSQACVTPVSNKKKERQNYGFLDIFYTHNDSHCCCSDSARTYR